MLKKQRFYTTLLCIVLSTNLCAEVLYCPEPSQIRQERMSGGFWFYTAIVNERPWAQLSGFALKKGPDVASFQNTTIFPYSTGYVGDMQCNYTATDGSPITLWSQIHIKPGFGLAGSAWKNSVLNNGIYPCGSTLITACPAVIVQNTKK